MDRVTAKRDRAAAAETDASIRVSAAVRRRLLTIQYARKMAGVRVSFNDIITEGLQALERAS